MDIKGAPEMSPAQIEDGGGWSLFRVSILLRLML